MLHPPQDTPLRLAVLEDDDELREAILLPGLRDYGHEVEGFRLAAGLLARLREREFDVVLIDVSLHDGDGFSVLEVLRERPGLGCVMLTGHARGRADQVRGLTSGADAYLLKPVDLEYLNATLHSVARRLRSAPSPDEPDQLARVWRLDAKGWQLVAPGEVRIALNWQERALVTRLLAADGEPVPRETLIADLAEDVHSFDPHRLEMLVHRLRRKALEASGQDLPLKAFRGLGYALIGS